MLVKVQVEPGGERVDGKVGSRGYKYKKNQPSGGIFEDLIKTLSKQEKQENLVQ